MEEFNLQGKFQELKCCVIIPTFNNAHSIKTVIQDVLKYTQNVFVINDGSTDNTQELLTEFPQLISLNYTPNMGKGMALRKGFELACSKGFEYAITIDSDGQHFAKDLPFFIESLKSNKNAIIIGSRNMTQSSVPGKSSFGNKFSNFWFKLETGFEMPDTQSGYRLYPIKSLKKFHFITQKYEFEIEVLVRAAWENIEIISIPVSVYYPPAEERVSHFRPFQDFTRISILNTFLVLITFLYIKPRNFIRYFQKKKIKEIIEEHLLKKEESNTVKSLSVGLGIFFGIAPFWGAQMLIVYAIAQFCKLNKALALIASNISIPIFLPFILYGSYLTGSYFFDAPFLDEIVLKKSFFSFIQNWMENVIASFHLSDKELVNKLLTHLWQYIFGSLVLATVSAILASILTFVFLKFKRS